MQHKLPELPYPKDALEPHISAQTIEYHYGKHHAGYVHNLNYMLPGSGLENASLEDIVMKSSGPLFNQAAQVWNHTFYWNCLSPQGGGAPSGALAEAINQTFGSFEEFKKQFALTAMNTFGAGWAWLVKKPDGTLAIVSTSNAQTPMTSGQKALLTCDVWEHAYYLDYRNMRANYIAAFWDVANWDFAARNFAG